MSGTFPSTPLPSSITLHSVASTLSDRTQSGRRNVRQTGAHLWRIDCTFPSTLTREQFMPVMAFIMAQEGQFGTFQFVSADLAEPRGTAAGTPVVSGGGQTGKELNTSGWAVSQTVLKSGDIVRMAGHSKVYMMTADVVSNGTGLATLPLHTPLMKSPANLEALAVTDVPFTVQLVDDAQKYTVSGPFHYQYNLSLIEVV